MPTAKVTIENLLLTRILKILFKVNCEVRFFFSGEIEMRTRDASNSHFLLVKLNKGGWKEYRRNTDFEIFCDITKLKQISEKSTISNITLDFSDSNISLKEEDPLGSVFTLKVFSTDSSVVNLPEFHPKYGVKCNSTQLIEGLTKLSIISNFFDIRNINSQVFFHSQEAIYGEGRFIVGNAPQFSSKTHFYTVSPFRDILEAMPDKTEIIMELTDQYFLRISISLSNVSFILIMAPSISE